MSRVVVLSEQGYGDAIMMERYIKLIPNALVSVQPPLVSWFRSRGHDAIATDDPLPEGVTHWIPMMSLPRLFGVIPPDTSQLGGKAVSSPERAPKVGICWSGNPDHANNADRSMPEAEIEPLFDLGLDWVSLQAGKALNIGKWIRFKPSDFLETARLIETLDCVVTVDTAVAHMAGTLGVPTLMLAPTAPEWRWGFGETTEWYPSMQIIRRRHTNDWPRAIEEVSRRLTEMAKRRAA